MKSFFLFLAILTPFLVFSQQPQGEITYTETVKMMIDFGDGPEAEEMKKMIPPTQSFPKTLFFSAAASLYQDKAGTEEEGQMDIQHDDGNGAEFQIKIQRPDNKFYRNLAEGTTTESREFFGRRFLISGDDKAPTWKIAGEQKKLLGYVCQKATAQIDSATSIVAWFTPQIPVSTGPSIHAGLPGLILELDMNNGQRTMEATQVDLKTLGKEALVQPGEGKEVTAEEFKKIEAEKMKEMNMETGGGAPGTMRMIIRN